MVGAQQRIASPLPRGPRDMLLPSGVVAQAADLVLTSRAQLSLIHGTSVSIRANGFKCLEQGVMVILLVISGLWRLRQCEWLQVEG